MYPLMNAAQPNPCPKTVSRTDSLFSQPGDRLLSAMHAYYFSPTNRLNHNGIVCRSGRAGANCKEALVPRFLPPRTATVFP